MTGAADSLKAVSVLLLKHLPFTVLGESFKKESLEFFLSWLREKICVNEALLLHKNVPMVLVQSGFIKERSLLYETTTTGHWVRLETLAHLKCMLQKQKACTTHEFGAQKCS